MTFTVSEILLLVDAIRAAKQVSPDVPASALPAVLAAIDKQRTRKLPKKSWQNKSTLFWLLVKLEEIGEETTQAIIDGRARMRLEEDGFITLESTRVTEVLGGIDCSATGRPGSV
jgi:hypothetical protein